MEKSWKVQGVWGSKVKPSGMENPVGWGVKLKKKKTLCGRGVWIFSGSTHLRIVQNYQLTSFFKKPVRKRICWQVFSRREKITVFFFNNLVHVLQFFLCVFCGSDLRTVQPGSNFKANQLAM